MPQTLISEDTVLTIRRKFPVPVHRLYEAWTNIESLRKWHAPGDYQVAEAQADVRVGGRYRITMKPPDKEISHTVVGEYQEVIPLQRLVHTWRWEEGGDGGARDTLVTLEFKDLGEESELILTHQGFAGGEVRDHHGKGWNGCLDNLEKSLA